ncbi:ribosomal protein S18-alanine N-acetyltransferase [Fundicoccus culcitae]|uniref:Ribosomal protein S18-alanine N-acetyltransferase n=1 Tax=Fundicoccus culcitae TaxID=2969821 RepID=A0ABY5P504_9LACT|nr:ribosomal protein S18-alanine N-acetyltransferase [Fundicoccus culcitae]UUX33629.1 ribosomal protein S18-alanine N-acetyltransferase [Fundicoccus culcitae]
MNEEKKEKQLQVVPFKGYQLPEAAQEMIIKANSDFNWSEKATRSDFENPNNEYYVMFDQKKAVGYVSLQHVLDEASITIVYIDASWRRQGLGEALLQFVIAQLQARGLLHLFLEVRAGNTAAIKLYQKVGFQQIAQRKNYYHNPQEDACILQMNLKEGETR